jgi:tetrahydromethanopterin S-methyltransferase subunit F
MKVSTWVELYTGLSVGVALAVLLVIALAFW